MTKPSSALRGTDVVGRRRALSGRWLVLFILGLAAFVGLLRSGAPPSASLHLTGSVVARAATTASPHVYDGPAQHAKPRHASTNSSAVDATGPGWQPSAADRDGAVVVASRVAAEAGAGGGRIVLGHYPEYVQLGEKLGARTFSMPIEVFDAMSAEEQWAANQAFLDDAISQGSEIHLATPANAAREGSFYERELQYMQSRGYSVSSDGTMLVPGR